jgi:phage baseplate assembly protein V
MGINREHLDQLRHLLRPLAARISNTIVRGVVQLADDGLKQQLLQLGALAGQTIADAENFQPYGLSAIPLSGAEHVTIFPNGDQSHPITIAVSDRRHRPTGGSPGEVTLHCHTGAVVIMKANGDIELHPAPGHEVLIRDAAGTVDRLVKRGEFLAHGHPTAATGPVSPPTAATPIADTGQFPGTTRMRAQ